MDKLKGNPVSLTVSSNVKNLRVQAGLTLEGFAAAISISISYVRMIENGKANITSKLAQRITDFFEIEVQKLYTNKHYSLKKPENIPSIKRFYDENVRNPQFFLNRKGENSVAHFLRTELISGGYLDDEREVGEIREHCLTKYQRKFDSKEMSRQLGRLVDEGLLSRTDKFGNGTVYLYRKRKAKDLYS